MKKRNICHCAIVMNDETECLIYNLVINIFINYKYIYMICKQFDKN